MTYASNILRTYKSPLTRPSGEVVYVRNIDPVTSAIYGTIEIASIGLSAYHGVKRNHGSAAWGLAWGFCGAIFPIITPVVAVAQGYAEPVK